MSVHHRSCRDHGQILTLVLAFVAFGGLVTTSIINMATTGLRASNEIQALRDERYAAAAGIDTHIEYLRNNPTLGDGVTACPTSSSSLNGVAVSVTCTTTASTPSGRDLVITASIASRTVLTARVFINAGTQPTVYVDDWTYTSS